MERQINILGNQSPYFEKTDDVHITNIKKADNVRITNIKQNSLPFPEELSEEKWNEFSAFIQQFLASEQACELEEKDRKILEKGNNWREMREILADTANVTTILLPLTGFVARHGEQIVQWINALFTQLI